MASTTGHEIKTFYEKTYPGERDDNGEWLAGQYAVKFDDLKAVVGPLQTSVNNSRATQPGCLCCLPPRFPVA